MAIKDFIEETEVFRLDEFKAACGDSQSNLNLLSRAARAGKVRRIRPGVYASNTGRYKGSRPEKAAVAAALAPDACLCYLSALSFYAGEHNVMFSASIYSDILREPVEFDGVTYLPYRYPAEGVETRTRRLRTGSSVLTTSKEQSVVDVLHRPRRCLGAEGALRTVSSILRVDAGKLADLAAARSLSTCSKTGWVMEKKAAEWHVDEKIVGMLRERLGSGPYYFDGRDRPKGSYDPAWKLYFPEPVETVEEWIRG